MYHSHQSKKSKSLYHYFLRTAFWLLWPAIWLYAPLRVRARVALVKDNTLLVVRHHFGTNTWQLPGGGIKKGETLPQAAVREIQEELGITIPSDNVHELIPKKVYTESGIRLRYIIFAVSLIDDVALRTSNEIAEFTWITASSNKQLSNHVRATQDALHTTHLLQ